MEKRNEKTAPQKLERESKTERFRRLQQTKRVKKRPADNWWEYYKSHGFNYLLPLNKDKTPVVKTWDPLYENPASDVQIETWKKTYPRPRIGIITGEKNNLCVFDCDSEEAVSELMNALPGHEFNGPISKTPTGGYHLWCRHTTKIESTKMRRGTSGEIDVKNGKGYVCVPPMQAEYEKPKGNPIKGKYEWVEGHSPNDFVIPEVPQVWVDIVLEAGREELRKSAIHREGTRHPALQPQSVAWAGQGLSEEEILYKLIKMNRDRCRPPKERRELEKLAKDAVNYVATRTDEEISQEIADAEEAEVVLGTHLTDMGNAERFARVCKHDTCFCHNRKSWLHYDGIKWEWNVSGKAEDKAKQTVRTIYQEAARGVTPTERKRIASYAMKSESNVKIRAMLGLAQSERDLIVEEDELDSNPWLLNVANGTLNLRSQRLGPHRAQDKHTKIAPVAYDPQAVCPRWDLFLNEITEDNEDLISFLQRAIGYALTGDIREQCLFIFYGTGANGKTTFLQAISALLGNYWNQSSSEMLLLSRHEGVPNDIARLKGTRFASIIEVEEGRRLKESLVKALTGGDTITARFLFHEYFEYIPQFKIFIGTNHKPVIKGTDLAIWRRIKLIPFTVAIPEENQDKLLLDKLKDELPGILNWAVEGCRLWQEHGLGTPEEVSTATSEYRSESDVLGAFLEERTTAERGGITSASILYQEYSKWCDDNNERAVNNTNFGRALVERGFERVRSGRGNNYRGIVLRGYEEGDNRGDR